MEVMVQAMLEVVVQAMLEVVQAMLEVVVQAMLEVVVQAILEVVVQAMLEVVVVAMLQVVVVTVSELEGATLVNYCIRAGFVAPPPAWPPPQHEAHKNEYRKTILRVPSYYLIYVMLTLIIQEMAVVHTHARYFPS